MMKKSLRTALLGAALACVMAVGAFAADSGVITGDVVNARKGPGTGYELVEMLAKGKTVKVLGEENGWYHIQWNDSKGYVKKDYLAVNGAAPAKSADATVTGGSAVNVRSGPGTSYSRVTTLAEGKRVAVLDKSGEWYHVSFGNTTGYILGEYLSVDGSSASKPAASTPVDKSVGNATITGGGSINVRLGPGTSYNRVTTLSEGKRVTAKEKSGAWYLISFNNTSGYVHGDYLDVDSGANVKTVEAPAKQQTEQPAVSQPAAASIGNATVTGGTINVRSGPDTGYDRVARVEEGTRVTLLTEEGGWFKVSFDGKSGYILGDFLKPDDGALASLVAAEGGTPDEPAVEAMASTPAQEASSAPADGKALRTAYIAGGTINVRSGPGTEFERVTMVSTGKKVNVLAEEDGWCKVSFGDTVGYVHANYVSDTEPPADGVGAQVANMVQQYLGVPYVYGGAAPGGFDCSGLTLYLYKQFGYSLPHSASGQYASCGYKVSRSELQPGDIVFFSSPGSGGRINHCAVYVGGGEIIHARYSVGRVYRNSLSENYYSTYYAGAIRIAG